MSDRLPASRPPDTKALMAKALVELREARQRARRLEEAAHAPVAIVGMSCRFPGRADSAETFRELLWRGTDAIDRVPADRWDAGAYFDPDPDAAGKIASPFGGFIDDVGRFDAEFFGVSPREAESMDPQHRLLLETTWRALEHARLPPGRLRGTDTGVFAGICTYDYAIRHLAGGMASVSAHFGTGNALSAAAGRLSYLFGFNGPSMSIDTACSSSLVCVHLACQALRHGECSTALAAGVNLILTPQTNMSFSRARMLAADGRCKPFDAAANGYVRGEGCGVVVLKLLADARRDDDPILAVIRGSAVNQDGASSGLTVPNGPAQQDVIRKALANSRTRATEVAYVEAHGTGTSLGDPIEARSLAAAYCEARTADSPLLVGSVKSNIGHLEGAAGVASLIKTVLALQQGTIPPSLHFTTPNPNVDWASACLRVVTDVQPWPSVAARVAGVSSFGFTGTNAHVIVEAGPAPTGVANTTTAWPAILPISARDPDALRQLVHDYGAALTRQPDASFADFAAAAALGREHFRYRHAVVAETSAEAASALLALDAQPLRSASSSRTGRFAELEELAARYVAGADIDWPAICDATARARVHVPEYPFRGARHWLPEAVKTRAAAHPLLGIALEAPGAGGVRFQSDLSPAEGDLGDHRVFERVLVPAAALLEMILAAGRVACGSDALLLEDFLNHRPLALEDSRPRAVQTVLESDDAKGFRATIFAEGQSSRGSSRDWQRIAEARIRSASGEPKPESARVVGDGQGQTYSVATIYAQCGEQGLQYGPAFRTLSRVERHGEIVQAEIAARATSAVDEGYYIRPSLLDGCLQASAVSYPEPPAGHLYLPVGIRRLTAYAPAGSALQCDAQLRHASPTRVETDLRLRAADGSLVAAIEGVVLLSADARRLDRAPHDPPVRRLVPRWTPRALMAKESPAPERVEVWHASGHDVAALCAQLRALGHTVATRDLRDLAPRGDAALDRSVVICPGASAVDDVPAMLSGLRDIVDLIGRQSPPPKRVLVVVEGAHAVNGTRAVPALAAVCGLIRSAQAERPELSMVAVDADRAGDSAALVVEELFANDAAEAAYRDGARYVRAFDECAPIGIGDVATRPIRGDRSYVVTGGLGDVGLHIAGWLADRGAGTIVLLGRRPPTPGQERTLDALRGRADIRVYRVDVADADHVHAFFGQAAADLPPIAAVFHAAGVTRDATLANQTLAHFEDVWRPKALGALNLLQAAKSLDLDGFVCIASIAGTLGAPGQANYAAANAWLEAFVATARDEGIPAQCLSYGPWENTGLTLRLSAPERAAIEARGVAFQPATSALDELGRLWDSGDLQRLVYEGASPTAASRSTSAEPAASASPAGPVPVAAAVRQIVGAILRMPAEGIESDVPLISIGLDSLMALELRARCRELYEVDIPAVDLIRDLTVAQVVARIEEGGRDGSRERPAPAEPADMPLSHGQRALWYLHQLQPASPAYNIAFAVRVRSAIDEAAFKERVRQLVMRHGQLRRTYHETESGLRQTLASEPAEVFSRHEAAGLDEHELHQRVCDEYRRPFDLTNGPVMRVALFTRGVEDHVLLIAMHHIAADAWSLWRMMEELREDAAPVATGSRYVDRLEDEETFLASPAAAAAWRYWQQELAGELPILNLRTDRPRPGVETLNGASIPFSLTPEESARLHAVARQEGSTIYALLLAAFQTLLHRYSGQDDILVGCPTAGRSRPESRETVGYFVNPIVVRARFAEGQSFRQRLHDARTRLLNGMSHADIPFPLIAERLGGTRHAGHSPVFQAAFVMQQLQDASEFAALMAPSEPARQVEWGGLRLEHYFLPQQEGQFDLTLEMVEAHDACHGLFKYNSDLWDAGTIVRMAEHFRALLRSIVEDPDTRIDALDILPADERASLRQMSQGVVRRYDLDRPLHRWIENQASRTPEAIAVEIEADSLSYAELDACANRLARELRRRGVTTGDPVPICAERSLELVVGLLGILKSGGAYVPLDPTYPSDRLRVMVADTTPHAVLVTAATRQHMLQASSDAALLELKDVRRAFHDQSDATLSYDRTPDSLAYTIYTSGSTGMPKGAMNTHRGIVNRLCWMQEAFPLTTADRVLQKTPYSFDVSVWELFWPLMVGAKLVLARPEGHRDNAYLADVIGKAGITTLHFVPPMLQAFLDEPGAAHCSSLRRVICSGQELPSTLQRRFFEVLPKAELHNLYGPTEAAVDVTWHRCLADDLRPFVPLGRPIANTSIYILDGRQQPVPIGVAGELHIGGVQVARGYLNRPQLTTEKFVPDPFGSAGATMYRTGDLARFSADGEIEFLGRTDFQVKIRGLRVELGEIEYALTSDPRVREAIVLLTENRAGTKRLAAYLVAAGELTDGVEDELRCALAASLPAYMIPDAFVWLDALPLTANGKIDRRALPPLPTPEAQSRAPHSDAERALADIWKTVLGLSDVGVEDNFFTLGGDSIRITQVISRARRAGYDLSVRDALARPTIAGLARLITPAAAPTSRPSAAPTAPDDDRDIPLLPMQRWLLAADGDRLSFNQTIALRTPGVMRADVLQKAFDDLVVRHQALRLRFPAQADGQRTQVCVAPERAAIDVERWTPGSDLSPRAVVAARARSFDISAGPLVAALVVEAPTDPHVLIAAHHLIVDGVSWRTLLTDLDAAYRARLDGRVAAFAEPAASFAAWAKACASFAASAAAESEAIYWLTEDWSRPFARIRTRDGADRDAGASDVRFDVALDDLPTDVAAASGYGTEALLLASLSNVLIDGTMTHDLRVDLEGHGREPLDGGPDGASVVGWCTALYPVALRIDGASLAERTASVGRSLSEVPAGGRAFGLCRDLSPRGRVRHALGSVPTAEILFNYLGRWDSALPADSLFTPALAESATVRLDAPSYPLEVNALQYENRLHVSLRFDRSVVDESWAAALADRWRAHLIDAAEQPYPLTSMQEGILFHALLNPGAGVYVQQLVADLDGGADDGILRQAWDAVLARHAVLRTSFRWKGLDAPVQQTAGSVSMPWSRNDWSGKTDEEYDAALAVLLDEDRQRGIDLTVAPLHRVQLLVRGNTCTMVWTHHHILLDGRSMFQVLHEVLETSRAVAAHRRPALPPVSSFRRFALAPAAADRAASLEYWRGQVADIEAPTAIPFLQRATASPRGDASETVRALSAEEANALRRLAREGGVTLNLLTQSLLALFMARLSGSERVLFGATVSTDLPGGTTVGLCINTIPIVTDVPAHDRLADWLQRRQRAQAERSPFEQTALVDIQRCSRIPAGEPPFELLFLFESYEIDEALGRPAGGFTLRDVRIVERTNYPIVVTVLPRDGVEIRLAHDASRYPREAAERFLDGYCGVLREAVRAGLDARLESVEALDAVTRQTMLSDWNATAAAPPAARCVPDLFREQCRARPDAVAVTCGGTALTYRELDTRARQIAAALVSRGVRPGALVGVCTTRGVEMVAALVGILDAGAAYVPLDPTFPVERLTYMLEDSGAVLTIAERRVSEELRTRLGAAAPVLLLDDIPGSAPSATITPPVEPHDLMYVIYTSGSTGRPKGVMIPHGAVLNFLSSLAKQPGLTADDRLLAVTTLSFDIAVLELFLPLTVGARVVIAESAADPRALMRAMDEEQATVMQATPATWRMLLEAGWKGNPRLRAFCGGEALHRDLSRALLRQCRELWNLYGPTETTVWSTVHEIRAAEEEAADGVAPIGRPIANTTVYVLDRSMRPVPIGAVGELFIGGQGLARGYHNNLPLTTERFVADPFAADAGARMYRTGDRARWRPDGVLEFLGRVDDQVKIRGHRIELGEIESVLGEHEAIGHCTVVIREDAGGEPRLVAYYTTRDAAIAASDLRRHLRARVPEYMVPQLVHLEQMPLSPNGKVDRKALPKPEPPGAARRAAKPGSPLEQQLAAVWSDVLGLEVLPSDDSFFDIGGHSLHLIQVQTRIARQFGVEVEIVELFRNPSIADLAVLIERLNAGLAPEHGLLQDRSATRLNQVEAQQEQMNVRRSARTRNRRA